MQAADPKVAYYCRMYAVEQVRVATKSMVLAAAPSCTWTACLDLTRC